MATLRFCPTFILKNRKPSESNPPVHIPGLLSDHILCPVRALRYYRKATASEAVRKSRKRLFITYKDVNQGAEISMPTISRWIVKVIKDSHSDVQEDSTSLRIHAIKAHEVRAVAASVNFPRASVAEIMQAMSWKSAGTFTKHYLRDLVPFQTELQAVGPFVAAKTVVSAEDASTKTSTKTRKSPWDPSS